MTTDQLAAESVLYGTRQAVEDLTARLATAVHNRDQAIIAAFNNGVKPAEIAHFTGLTRHAIQRITGE